MTLKELADRLGLSPTTVSRALNGYPEVNAETRARIEIAARDYGYRANTMARKLATGRSMAIGHVIPLSNHQMINPIFAEFMAGASEIYSSEGYETLLAAVPAANEVQTYRELARRRSVDGLIVHAPRLNDPRVDLLRELELPFVVHGRSVDIEDRPVFLDTNNRRSFEQATTYLIELGHTRFALLNGMETISFARRRRRGFEQALQNNGLRSDASRMVDMEMTETNAYDVTMKWLNEPKPPTAILTSSTISALGVARAIRDAGLQIGDDVSLITHDDDLSFMRNVGDPPPFTALQSPIRDAGAKCARMLIDHIAGKKVSSEIWKCEFIEGRSTGPAPKETPA
ncbi:LacI family transcriptional regulator [Monaibacterium marinum]|uniref:LacI family transcriptional regulator n=1 Tax=Pontivivens marinum TaxID=1690039 RepID=A0A2C9CNF3_9RHOB|nr:substrate-binding domain-containing protein [Monaibacterium marinum]SOH92738.1 LacI family transcriptional regulator [Monaibacterium marinum]